MRYHHTKDYILFENLFQTLIKFTYQLFFIKMSPDKTISAYDLHIYHPNPAISPVPDALPLSVLLQVP